MTDGHDELHELTGGYALGALSIADRQRFEAHLATCDRCAVEVRGFGWIVAGLADVVPYREPSARLRQRVLLAAGGAGPQTGASREAALPGETIRRDGPSRLPAWAAVAAAVAALLIAGYSLRLRERVEALEARLRDAESRAAQAEGGLAVAQRAAAHAQSALSVMAAPDLARVELAPQPAAAAARGRAFWSRSQGLVFTAANLPPLPADRIYQLWIVTAQAPISAGLITPDPSGSVTAVFETSPDVGQPVAMAVTLEPAGGVPSPTGDKVLVGTVNQSEL
jgi:anti-sigma-K factor RskA